MCLWEAPSSSSGSRQRIASVSVFGSGFDTRPFAPATPATLAGYAVQNSETERASGCSRSPSLFQSDYRIGFELRHLCEQSCDGAEWLARHMAGEQFVRRMRDEIQRSFAFAQDDGVFERQQHRIKGDCSCLHLVSL